MQHMLSGASVCHWCFMPQSTHVKFLKCKKCRIAHYCDVSNATAFSSLPPPSLLQRIISCIALLPV